jgi:AcrR family transcriptional regulator
VQSNDPAPPKPLRADARRNREALLTTARAVFAAGELDIRIEEIARRAGVGVGTLYRHFETRDAIVEAVYRQEIDALCGSAAELLAALPADQALHAFLRRLVDHLAANVGLAKALSAVMAASSIPFSHGNQQMLEALELLMTAAAATGRIRADVAAPTVLMALAGLCMPQDQPQWEERAGAVIALVMDGLRFGAAGP